MRRRLLILCLLAPLVLTGCSEGLQGEGRDPGPLDTASSPSPRPTAADSPACRLLTSKERKSISGEALDQVAPTNVPKGSQQCRWVKSLQAPTPTLLQIVTSPAQVWAKSIPAQVDRAVTAGRSNEKLLKRLQAAKKAVRHGADKLSDKEACDMFSLMGEVYGRRKGVKEVVSFPAFGTQLSVNARTCTDGVYLSLTYTEAGLKPSSPLSFSALRMLHIAQARATKVLPAAND